MPDGPVTPVIEKVGLHDAFHGGARLGRADVVMCRKGRPVVDAKAYSEARERERDVVLPDGTHVGRTSGTLAASRAYRSAYDGKAS